METEGKAEVVEAVAIAVLISALTGLLTWGIESLKTRAVAAAKKTKKKKPKA